MLNFIKRLIKPLNSDKPTSTEKDKPMKTFNLNLLLPKDGKIDAEIFENSYINIPRSIFYMITVPLEKFEIENEKTETLIELSSMNLKIKKLEELENKTFTFPTNPEDGYIDGSLYFKNVYNPFDVTKIEFGKFENGNIKTTLHYEIDFEYEMSGFKKTEKSVMEVNLLFGMLKIHSSILAAEKANLGKAEKIVSSFISSKNLESPEILNRQIHFGLKLN